MPKQIIITADDRETLLDELHQWIHLLGGDVAPDAKKPAATRRSPATKPKPTAAPEAPEAPEVTVDALRAAVQTAIDAHGEFVVKALFKRHKAKKFSDFKPRQFAAVLAEMEALGGDAEDSDEISFDD
jgi:hypothetical protein